MMIMVHDSYLYNIMHNMTVVVARAHPHLPPPTLPFRQLDSLTGVCDSKLSIIIIITYLKKLAILW